LAASPPVAGGSELVLSSLGKGLCVILVLVSGGIQNQLKSSAKVGLTNMIISARSKIWVIAVHMKRQLCFIIYHNELHNFFTLNLIGCSILHIRK
jgi:hypothetical protein